MAEIKLTKQTFKEAVMAEGKTALVDFWAAWCGPCQKFAPVIAEVAAETDGKVTVGKVNIDEEPELAEMFDISSIPTLKVFKNGEVVNTAIGYSSKEEVLKLLK